MRRACVKNDKSFWEKQLLPILISMCSFCVWKASSGVSATFIYLGFQSYPVCRGMFVD